MSTVEIKKRLDAAIYEIEYAYKILNGEVYGDIEYAASRLIEAKKQLDVISRKFE